MKLLRLNRNICLYFYGSFLGEDPVDTYQKTVAVPRYSHATVFHWNCLIQMF